MTIEEIRNRLGEIEQRSAEIEANLETPEADLEALNEEARKLVDEKNQLNNQLEEILKAAQAEEEIRQKIANGEIGEIKEKHEEEKTMNEKEIRSSAAYAEAYKKYILTGEDKECRTLLSQNASTPGTVPVPVVIENIIKTAWESNELLNRISKTYFRGNLKVPFEKSADPAYVHAEGTTGLTEEDLEIGLVELKPENNKKWIKISDEAIAMGGEAFVEYIGNEMVYRVLNKLVAQLIAKVNAASTSHSSSAIGIPKVTEAPGVTTIRNATTQLSEEATNLCVVMNPLTQAEFFNAQAAGNFNIDPFAGLPVIKCSAIPAYSSASANAMYAIVGDLKALQANYPEGEGVILKWDDLTYAEDDLVKVIARQYAGYGVTAPGKLVKLCKPAGTVTT